eukprot:1111037_1
MPALFKYLSQKLPIKYLNKMRNIPHRSYGKIPLTMRRTLPILSRPKLSSQSVRRRFYSNNFNNNDLLERLRTGQITKAEVQRLIMNQQSNPTHQSSNGYKTIQSMSDYPTQMQPPIHTGTAKITPMHATGGITASSSIPTISTIGSKTNPLDMKRQTSFKEFIFSLFPFLFIFWMLGGMFSNNYNEWDAEDWEDDNDELTNEDGTLTTLKNKSDEKHHTKDKEKTKRINWIDALSFFKKLSIDLKANQDQDPSRDTQQMAVQKDKKKRKRIRFKNVCGNEEAKVDLIDLVDYLKNPNKYRSENEMQTARALAGEAGVPFLATNGASFDEIFVGVGVMRVRKLFERAKERAPCIVFIDEIDAIANTRMQMGTAHSSDSLNALLSEMDGFEQNSGVIVIAATNMPDRLDAALVRPGRFDRKVHLQLPDKRAREDIVRLYLGERGDSTVNVSELVGDISGFSGAELESMVNLASIECVKEGKGKVSHAHLIEAKEVISMGRARRTLDIGLKTKAVTAYHEGGHAIVSLYTRGAKPVYKATILPRGAALGFVASINEDEFMATKESLLAQLDVCMGGRAAEEIYSGSTQITTGASSDFNQATRIAMGMVCQYGMSDKVGRVYYNTDDINKLSPDTQNVINSEVKRLLDESYYRATQIIHKHKKQWQLLAKGLLDKETLTGEEIRSMIDYHLDQQIQPIDHILTKIKENQQSQENDTHTSTTKELKKNRKIKNTSKLMNNIQATSAPQLLNPNV